MSCAGPLLLQRVSVSHKQTKTQLYTGFIKLELPVFHIGYLKNTVQILQCICKSCSRVLLAWEERRAFLRRFRSLRTERVQREAVFKRVLDRCKRTRLCPHCGAENGGVKKVVGTLKLVHDVTAKSRDRADALADDLALACAHNEQLRACLGRTADDLNPLRVRSLFAAIPQAVRGAWMAFRVRFCGSVERA